MTEYIPKPEAQSIMVQAYSISLIATLTAQLQTVARSAKNAQLAIEEMPGAKAQKDAILPALMDLQTAVWQQVDMLRCTRATLGMLCPGVDRREDDE